MCIKNRYFIITINKLFDFAESTLKEGKIG